MRQAGLPYVTDLEFLRTFPLVPSAHLSSGYTCSSALAAQDSLAAREALAAPIDHKMLWPREMRWPLPIDQRMLWPRERRWPL